VTAAVANVPLLMPMSSGSLQVYPTSGGLPSVSRPEVAIGQTIPPRVTVPVSARGQVSIDHDVHNQTASESVQVLMDVEGCYTTPQLGSAGLVNPITPVRIATLVRERCL